MLVEIELFLKCTFHNIKRGFESVESVKTSNRLGYIYACLKSKICLVLC